LRTECLEAIAGEAEGFSLAAKMAASINRSNQLHKTYALSTRPRSTASMRRAGEAVEKCAASTNRAQNYQRSSQIEYQLGNRIRA
jgi:hypothetical protein